jgi:hypothetical protein
MVNKYPVYKIAIIVIVFCLVYGIGFLPSLYFHNLVTVPLMNSLSILSLLLAGISLFVNFFIFCFSEVFSTCFFIRLFKLQSKEGETEVGLHDKRFFKFALNGTIHFVITQILYHVHMYPLKALQLRLLGNKIGKNVTFGGRVADACLFEIGDNSVVGGYCDILTHSIEHGKIIWKKVKIGNNCVLGQNSTILPGVVMEDGSMLGAMSLVTKGTRIRKGEVWGGVPAKKLK